jgi:hypothetical protein
MEGQVTATPKRRSEEVMNPTRDEWDRLLLCLRSEQAYSKWLERFLAFVMILAFIGWWR